jgi:hypothetical protein
MTGFTRAFATCVCYACLLDAATHCRCKERRRVGAMDSGIGTLFNDLTWPNKYRDTLLSTNFPASRMTRYLFHWLYPTIIDLKLNIIVVASSPTNPRTISSTALSPRPHSSSPNLAPASILSPAASSPLQAGRYAPSRTPNPSIHAVGLQV